MKDRNQNGAGFDDLSPEYDHYVNEALDYANGHLLPEDAAAFRERMKSDETFRRVVTPVLEAHEGPRSTDDQVRKGWADLRSRIEASGMTPPAPEAIEVALQERKTDYEQRVKARSYGNWGLIKRFAAVFAFLLAIPLGITGYIELVLIERVTSPKNVVSTVHLPDGSFVRLEPGAFLRYPKRIGTKPDRWVEFKGEGRFTVIASPGRPFRVETETAHITAVGTNFDVRTGDDLTVVLVTEGTVKVQRIRPDGTIADDSYTLGPGDSARIMPMSSRAHFPKDSGATP